MPDGGDFPGGKGGGPQPFSNAFKGASLNSLRYNTSQAGSPLPLAYGTVRVTVNVVEGFGFHGSKGGGKGGKGGLTSGTAGKKGSNQSFTVNVAFALAQGPCTITGSPLGFSGHNRVWSNGGIAGFDKVGLNFYAGDDGQAADPVFLSSDTNTPVENYSGTCYVTGTPMQLGSTPALPNIQFEIGGFEVGTVGPGFPGDANPASIIVDLLTNTRYGAGFPIANLDVAGSLADFGTYCQAAQLAMSMLLDRQQPCARWVEEIALLTVAAVVWSPPLLKIIPYSDQNWAGNSATWTPTLTAQYTLTDADFLDFGGGSDPAIVTRNDVTIATNWLSIELMDAGNSFNPMLIPVWDQGMIDRYGTRLEPSVQGHQFTNSTSALVSALLMLRRKTYVRNVFKFKLGWRFSRLEPMDIVEITDAAIGLAAHPVRVTQVDEDDNGELTVTAEELPNSPIVLPPTQTTAGLPLDQFVDPGNANPPIVFEPLRPLTGGALEVWMIATGGTHWGGAQVWVSTDNATYALAGTVFRGGRQGLLTASFANHADPDTVDTLSVDLTISEGTLLSGTAADANNFVTLCFCDGELISYQDATLTSAFHYDIGTLIRRGLFGTTVTSHAINSPFARFGPNDPSLFKYTYPENFIGLTIYIKLVSFNQFGQALQDISTLTPITYVLTGAGAVGSFTVQFSYNGASPPVAVPILTYTFADAVKFPTNLVDSVGKASVGATLNTIFDVAINGTNFATMTYAPAALTATFSGTAQNFVAGDVLTIIPRITDATLAGITGFLAGSS